MKQAESIIRMTMEESTKIVNFIIPRAGDQKTLKKNIFYSKTSRPITTELGTKHPWVKGIQVCSNEGHSPFSKGR